MVKRSRPHAAPALNPFFTSRAAAEPEPEPAETNMAGRSRPQVAPILNPFFASRATAETEAAPAANSSRPRAPPVMNPFFASRSTTEPVQEPARNTSSARPDTNAMDVDPPSRGDFSPMSVDHDSDDSHADDEADSDYALDGQSSPDVLARLPRRGAMPSPPSSSPPQVSPATRLRRLLRPAADRRAARTYDDLGSDFEVSEDEDESEGEVEESPTRKGGKRDVDMRNTAAKQEEEEVEEEQQVKKEMSRGWKRGFESDDEDSPVGRKRGRWSRPARPCPAHACGSRPGAEVPGRLSHPQVTKHASKFGPPRSRPNSTAGLDVRVQHANPTRRRPRSPDHALPQQTSRTQHAFYILYARFKLGLALVAVRSSSISTSPSTQARLAPARTTVRSSSTRMSPYTAPQSGIEAPKDFSLDSIYTMVYGPDHGRQIPGHFEDRRRSSSASVSTSASTSTPGSEPTPGATIAPTLELVPNLEDTVKHSVWDAGDRDIRQREAVPAPQRLRIRFKAIRQPPAMSHILVINKDRISVRCVPKTSSGRRAKASNDKAKGSNAATNAKVAKSKKKSLVLVFSLNNVRRADKPDSRMQRANRQAVQMRRHVGEKSRFGWD
ncbi:hypothetical protein BDV95DRAFT_598994 [Massariosphaeria phaeospora]|uniref:Uncharacterized protein n=1 Tax=Massariosphaeria phaeospora TaxID=100035 RepID=A0A7C8I3X3_9PLEO|nr:hypothetical protein BDV95DRAFT_598994 [Massariosphaeria phaeospora]